MGFACRKVEIFGSNLFFRRKKYHFEGVSGGCKKKKGLKLGEKGDFVKVVKKNEGRRGDALWLEIGGRDWNSREEQLNRCLVGKWKKGEEFLFNTDSLRRWGKHQWNLQAELSIKKLLAARIKISVNTDISVIGFYGNIGNIGNIGKISVDIFTKISVIKIFYILII